MIRILLYPLKIKNAGINSFSNYKMIVLEKVAPLFLIILFSIGTDHFRVAQIFLNS